MEPAGKYDGCYLPRRVHVTGDIDIHELAWDKYDQLLHLPRRTRRALQRQWKRSLAALALLLALGQAPALAATLTVTTTDPNINGDGQCALIEAIENANADAQTHTDCLAGSGADTINVPANSTHTLTEAINSPYGDNGLPVVISTITIEGNGSTIKRDPAVPDQFRIFAVKNTGNLTLNACTVSGGNPRGGGGLNSGGGIANYYGVLTLENSTVSGNNADGKGGGVFTRRGTVTLTNSTASGNSAASEGGGVYNAGGTVTLLRTLVSGNTARTGAEVYRFAGIPITAADFNLFGHSALTNAQAFSGFTPGASDITRHLGRHHADGPCQHPRAVGARATTSSMAAAAPTSSSARTATTARMRSMAGRGATPVTEATVRTPAPTARR